ncbi:ABC transporter substrate-binding protein [Pseudonocardia sp. NPDC046786]|uniref:ABC transporter substrate-binding protein n=1 Tax=Pseudonocardia sp. NPDC046786 TaxID=3155471 RepID=UPI0033E5BFB8
MTGSTILAAESVVELPSYEVYGSFGRPDSGSWMFDARCGVLAVGSAVRLTLPVATGGHGRPGVEMLGRISALRPNEMICIEHVQPWRGRLRLSFDRVDPARTRVRVRASVPADGVEWLVRHVGGALPVRPARSDVIRIGLVTSKSGPAAIYSMATEYLAGLAVDEVNDDRGIDGHLLELLVADDATEAATAAHEAVRLVRSGCRAIFACTTSSSFAAISRAVRGTGVLLVHSVMNERSSADGENVVRFGEQPADQIAALAGPIMRATGGRNWFLVGERYSWSYGAHHAARATLPRTAGRVVGESYAPLGTADFTPVIERIQRSGADIVMSSLIGADEVDFQRQFAASGLRSTVGSLSLVMDEPTTAHVGADAAEGIWTALGYLEDGPVAGNSALVARYRERYGRWAPPISTLSETVYEAILQYAQAVRHDPDADATRQRLALLTHRSGRSGTEIGARDLVAPRLYLAEVRGGGLRIFDEDG